MKRLQRQTIGHCQRYTSEDHPNRPDGNILPGINLIYILIQLKFMYRTRIPSAFRITSADMLWIYCQLEVAVSFLTIFQCHNWNDDFHQNVTSHAIVFR